VAENIGQRECAARFPFQEDVIMDRRRFLQSSVLLSASALSHAQRPQQSGSYTAPLPPAIQALKNRAGEAKGITLAEREMRLERARLLMAQNKVDAILMAGGTSLTYFTSVRWGNSERMMCFVLPAKGDPFFVVPHFEEGRLRERLDTVPGGQNVHLYLWQEDDSPYELVRKGLANGGLLTGTLGVEEKTPFVFANEIARVCPGLHLVDATPVVAGCRMIKSPAELALMRLACSITMQVYEAAWRSAQPGMTTHEFSDLCVRAYAHMGVIGETSCQTGLSSALPHGSLAPQLIKENAIVQIDDGCFVEGYQSDISRVWVYGTPTDIMLRRFDVVHRAQAAARDAARPGVECQQVDAAARKVMTDAGLGPDYKTFVHRVGHGIGMDMHEWPYLVRGNTTKLQSGMTFSDEPATFVTGEFGLRLEDDMVITETGAELLTPQSPSLRSPFGE
jgi:Xaa-Pro dipeptidase